jgi:hypothetical protein
VTNTFEFRVYVDWSRSTTKLHGQQEAPCFWCGEPTRWVDLCFHSRVCSHTCEVEATRAWIADLLVDGDVEAALLEEPPETDVDPT